MRWRALVRMVKREAAYYGRLYRHPETPWAARWCLWAALGYLAMPFDLVPDFVPVIGHLDDVVIVGGLVALALRLIPPEVRRQCRDGQGASPAAGERQS